MSTDGNTVPSISHVPLAGSAGAPVVMLVGAGLGTGVQALWSECAGELTALLGDDVQVIGWDLPGHGCSPEHGERLSIGDLAYAVAGLVARLRESGEIGAGARVFYAGVSINGAVALQLGLDHGELFDGIAVICSAAKIGEAAGWAERAELVREQGTEVMVEGSTQRWFAPGFVDEHPGRVRALLDTLEETDRFSYARLCEALADFDVRDQLAKITVPMLTVHGADDAVCPPERGEEIVARVAQGQAVVLDDVAHQAPLEAPESTARVLGEWLESLRG
ncbi:MAG: alpha/beta hydrolase [Micrococcus sp.]|nr:alpha/beta hydrolase [Micrococcus sp.]